MTDAAITIASSLLSGFIGVSVSTIYYRRFETKKFKMDTVKKFVANRYDLKGDEFSRALNEIFLVFNNSEKVMVELEAFHSKITTGQPADDSLVGLMRALCIEVDIDSTKFKDSFFLHPFNTRPSSSTP